MTMDVLDRVATPDPRISVSGAAVKLDNLTKDFAAHRVLKASILRLGQASSSLWSVVAAAESQRCCG